MFASSIPTTQSAAVLKGAYGDLHSIVNDWPVPRPTADEALVRIEASGICSGDINPRDGHPPAGPTPNRPLVTGHEGIGYIVALGNDQKNIAGFSVGDRVGLGWRRSTCHECYPCHNGMESICQKTKVNGYDAHGTHQGKLFPY